MTNPSTPYPSHSSHPYPLYYQSASRPQNHHHGSGNHRPPHHHSGPGATNSTRLDRLQALAKLSMRPLPQVLSALAHNRVPSGTRQSVGQRKLRHVTKKASVVKKRLVHWYLSIRIFLRRGFRRARSQCFRHFRHSNRSSCTFGQRTTNCMLFQLIFNNQTHNAFSAVFFASSTVSSKLLFWVTQIWHTVISFVRWWCNPRLKVVPPLL